MRDLEAIRQAEDALFKKAAKEIHDQGAAWFSLLDVAAQIAVENKRLRGVSVGNRVMRLVSLGRSQPEPVVTIDDGLYTIAGRLQGDGSLERRRGAEGREVASLYRLAEETETIAA